MITRIVKLTLEPKKVEEFKIFFKDKKSAIENNEGCYQVILLQDIKYSNIFFTYGHWENEMKLNNYRNSELFNKIWRNFFLVTLHLLSLHWHFYLILFLISLVDEQYTFTNCMHSRVSGYEVTCQLHRLWWLLPLLMCSQLHRINYQSIKVTFLSCVQTVRCPFNSYLLENSIDLISIYFKD